MGSAGRRSSGAAITVALLLLLVSLGIAVVFVRAAVGKFLGNPDELAPFVEFGWPMWMVPAVGIAEVAGSIALVLPPTRRIGALLLLAVMCGAAATNIANGHPDFVWLNVVLGIGALAVGVIDHLVRRRRSRHQRES